jgi:hypothetical protein
MGWEFRSEGRQEMNTLIHLGGGNLSETSRLDDVEH